MIGVFGANGFIGRHLVRQLADLGVPTRAISRRFDPEFENSLRDKVDFVVGDLKSPLEMTSSLEGVEVAVQLVSTSSPGLRNAHVIADIHDNVVPHIEFCQLCIQREVKRIIFLSSGGTVYGPHAPIPTPETAATAPISSHGLTKLVVEKYLAMFAHVNGLPSTILRLANPYGEGQEFHKGQGLIPAVLDRHARNMPISIFGSGLARRDYIYISDVIDAIVAAVRMEGRDSHILNIGSGETRSILEVLEEIEKHLPTALIKEYVPERSTDVFTSCLDISAAERVISWSPKIPFSVGIAKTVSLYRFFNKN